MIETEKDTEKTDNSPFQEEVVLENYFPCANRSEVLSQMEEAVQEGANIMVLTGEEGSGKTMICRLLEHELSPFCTTVFFPHIVDSFEDVVRGIAMRLGLNDVAEMDGWDLELALESIADQLLDESVDLVVIFDEAENLFLATLERIHQMLDKIIGSGARIHILFSGQETLLENCEQLSLCDFQNTDDLHFDLRPLTEVETADYLQSCCTRLKDQDVTKVFSEEVVSNIYSLAKGNFRTTNILAEESVKSHSDDTSFMVLLDGVTEDYSSGNEDSYATKYSQLIQKITQYLRRLISGKFRSISRHVKKVTGDMSSISRSLVSRLPEIGGKGRKSTGSYLPWIGGGLCCLLLLFYLFGSGDDDNSADQNIYQPEEAVQLEVVTKKQELIVHVPEAEKPEEPMETQEPLAITQAPEENLTVVQISEEKVHGGESSVVLPVDESTQQDIDPFSAGEQEAATENGALKKTEVIGSENVDDAGDRVIVEAEKTESSQETQKGEVAGIVKLRPAHDLKKKPVPALEPQHIVIKVQSQKEIRSTSTSNNNFAADKLYNERVLAGLGWKGSGKDNMYTVQLMALASKSAEENLKKMLAQVNYRQEAGNFYIFRKATRPENIFVFYGEYQSIERARLVQNSLPKFLRDHKPYVLSIKGAVAKAGK